MSNPSSSSNELAPEFHDIDEGIDAGTGSRTACVLVLDTSYSMTGAPIQELNDGVQMFAEALHGDDIACTSVEVAVITFGGDVELHTDFQLADNFQAPQFSAGGGTPMYEALQEAIDLVDVRKGHYHSQGLDYHRPWIWLMTDGEPTDDEKKTASVQALESTIQNKGATLFTVGIGEDAEYSVLKEISTERAPLKLKGVQYIREMFQWLSNSLSATSRSTPGEQVPLDAAGWGTVAT